MVYQKRIMRYILLLLISWTSFASFGINKLDSLIPKFANATIDERNEIVFEIQAELERLNVDSLLYFVNILYDQSEQENRTDIRAFAEYYFGSYLASKGMQNTALQKYKEVIPFFEQEENDSVLAIVYNLIGNAHFMNGSLLDAEESYLTSTSYGKKSKKPKFEFFSFSNLFRVYLAQERYDEAKEIIDLFIRFYNSSGNNRNLATGYGLLGQYHLEQGDIDAAIPNYERSLELNLSDGAPLLVANGYTNMAIACFYKEDYLRAKQYFKLALSYREMVGIDFYIIESYHNLGDYFHGLSEYDSSIVYYQKAITLSDSTKNYKALVDASTELAAVYESLSMFKQQKDVLKRIIATNKLIFKEKNNSELAAMRIHFERDKENLKEQTFQREEVLKSQISSVKSNWSNWIWISSGCGVFLLVLLYIIKRSSQTKT